MCRNAGKQLPTYMVQHKRRSKNLSASWQNPAISHTAKNICEQSLYTGRNATWNARKYSITSILWNLSKAKLYRPEFWHLIKKTDNFTGTASTDSNDKHSKHYQDTSSPACTYRKQYETSDWQRIHLYALSTETEDNRKRQVCWNNHSDCL